MPGGGIYSQGGTPVAVFTLLTGVAECLRCQFAGVAALCTHTEHSLLAVVTL